MGILNSEQKIGSANKNIDKQATLYDIVDIFFWMATDTPLYVKNYKDYNYKIYALIGPSEAVKKVQVKLTELNSYKVSNQCPLRVGGHSIFMHQPWMVIDSFYFTLKY